MATDPAGEPLTPKTDEQLRDVILSQPRVRVVGGGSKPTLSAGANVSLEHIRGIVEYLPDEYTITVRAATPIAEIQAALDEHHQYLPFDPPFSSGGATIGGTVAAGVSGPGRFRYGGVRDFVLGVTFLSGDGRFISGGGKVVKNAAGFDIPKLMVGSLGEWGILTELTFKVFPFPKKTLTLTMQGDSWSQVVGLAHRLAVAPLDLMCLELAPPNQLAVRLGGQPDSLPERAACIKRFFEESTGRASGTPAHQESTGRASGTLAHQELTDDRNYWRDAADLTWVEPNQSLIRMPLNPSQLESAEEALAGVFANSELGPVSRRYSVGGNLLWMAGEHDAVERCTRQLASDLKRSAVALFGEWGDRTVGAPSPSPMASRLRRVFDPTDRLVDVPS